VEDFAVQRAKMILMATGGIGNEADVRFDTRPDLLSQWRGRIKDGYAGFEEIDRSRRNGLFPRTRR
jgi:hypothetical protein